MKRMPRMDHTIPMIPMFVVIALSALAKLPEGARLPAVAISLVLGVAITCSIFNPKIRYAMGWVLVAALLSWAVFIVVNLPTPPGA